MEALKLEVDANLALVFPRFRIATKPVKIHQESGLQNRKASLVRFTEQHRKECRNLQHLQTRFCASQWNDVAYFSREAAQEFSPQRKLWV